MNNTRLEIFRNDLIHILDLDNLRHYIDDEAYSVDYQIESYFKLYHPEYKIVFCAVAGELMSKSDDDFAFTYSVVAEREDTLINVMMQHDWYNGSTITVSDCKPLKIQTIPEH